MTHETVLLGPLTRDFTHQDGLRWSQPGGAPWHAGLALRATGGPADRVQALATAGPWSGRFGLPGLIAHGVRWAGRRRARDTVFRNRYAAAGRRQTLLDRAAPIEPGVLGHRRPEVAVLSALMPDDIALAIPAALRDRGTFVGADAQGFLRRVDNRGRVRTQPADLAAHLPGVAAVKFSERELRVHAGLGADEPWAPAAASLARALRAEVIVSRGARGAALTLADAARPITAPAPPLEANADATGAGDILLATYSRARSRGLGPAPALDRAVRETHAVLRGRGGAHAVPGGAPALLGALRALQAVAVAAQRRARRRPLAGDCFPLEGALAVAVRAHLPGPLPQPDGVAGRAAALVSVCWALFSMGWPTDAALSPLALRRAADDAAGRLPRAGEVRGRAGR